MILNSKTIGYNYDQNVYNFLFKGDAVPPWVGFHEEEVMKSQIIALSSVFYIYYLSLNFFQINLHNVVQYTEGLI